MSSFQGVGIGGVPLYTEVSLFQGVEIEALSLFYELYSKLSRYKMVNI